jgi:extracellular factor (EF) 3-hydroxypalmitic acid methyl ester biosynthesis protein
MAIQYSELQGAFGRQAHYRPQRFRARELLSPLANPELRIAGKHYPLLDVSTNGAAISAPIDVDSLQVGGSIEADFLVYGRSLQKVRGRVARIESTPRGARVGIGLVGSYFDLDQARRIDSRAALEHQLSSGPHSTSSAVPRALLDAVSEAVHVVQYYKRALQAHEEDARRAGEQAVCELAAQAYEKLAPAYAALRERASDAALEVLADKRALAAAKHYTETMLTPLLLSAPMIRRAYEKPLGYPGDYQVMLHYYDDAFEGDTAFAKAFHKLFVRHPLSAGVCTRKDFVVGKLTSDLHALRARGDLSPFQITSLGCGPAKEVPGFVEALPEWQGVVHFRLIDQEPRTLQVAFDAAQRALSASSGASFVECLNLSFGQLLKQPALLKAGGPQNFIFSTGLFDYLPLPTARQLIAALYDCLKPGGTMIIGNAKGPNRYFFCPEFVLDWSLIYRSLDDMKDMAKGLPGEARTSIELESGDAYWFLEIRKPRHED